MLPFTPEGLLPIRMQQGIRIPQKFINRKNLNIAIPIHAMGIHTNRKQGNQGPLTSTYDFTVEPSAPPGDAETWLP
jgi:hypothetical protein